MTLNKRSAALLVLPALAASLLTVGTASAGTADGGGGGRACRAPHPADGLSVGTCIDYSDDGHFDGEVITSGSNSTMINLCVELVDVHQNLVPGTHTCRLQPGPSGRVKTPVVHVGPGTYYAQSYFTSPTYFYGGESPGIVYPY